MEKFKVGDRIVCISEKQPNPVYGTAGVVVSYTSDDAHPYQCDFEPDDLMVEGDTNTGWWMSEDEIALHKEYKVLQILRKWQKSR